MSRTSRPQAFETLLCAFVLFLAGVPALGATDVWLPAVAHGRGACPGGVCAEWRSDLFLLGPAEITFHPRTGTAADLSPIGPVSVGSGIHTSTSLFSRFGLSEAYGALRITGYRVFASGRIYDANVTTSRGAGTSGRGQSFPAMSAALARGAGQFLILPGLAQGADGAFRSNIGFVEVDGNRVTATATLLSAEGAALGTKSWSLAPFEVRQVSLAELAALPGDNVAVRIDVAGEGRLLAYGSRIDNRTGDPFTIRPIVASVQPVFSSGAGLGLVSRLAGVVPVTDGWLPVVTHAPGACPGGGCAQWRSDVWIRNDGVLPADVTLHAGAERRVVTVNPGAQRELADVVLSLFGKDNASFPLRISSELPVAVTSRIYDRNVTTKNNGTGTAGQFFPAVPTAAALGPGESAILFGLAEDDTTRSNFGLVAVDDAVATVGVNLYDSTGTPFYTEAIPLSAGGSIQKSLRSIGGPIPDGTTLLIRNSGPGRVLTYGSRIDNRTGDPITIEPFLDGLLTESVVIDLAVRFSQPVSEEERPEVLSRKAELEATGETVAADGSSVTFPLATPAGWRATLGDQLARVRDDGLVRFDRRPGAAQRIELRDAGSRYVLARLDPWGAQPLVAELLFDGPCGMDQRVPAGCPAPGAEERTADDAPHLSSSCEFLDGPLENYTWAAILGYAGSTCQQRVISGCCPNEGGWLIDRFPKICCQVNHKGRFCQDLTPGRLVFNGNSDYLIEPGRSVTFEIINDGCRGDETITLKPESKLHGDLSGPGLTGATDFWMLMHYDEAIFDAWKAADPDCRNPERGWEAWVGPRTLTYTLPKCMRGVKGEDADFFVMEGEGKEIPFKIALEGTNLYRFVGGDRVFSSANALRDGWRAGVAEPGCDGMHLHGLHPCTGAADPAPNGCGHGKIEKVQ